MLGFLTVYIEYTAKYEKPINIATQNDAACGLNIKIQITLSKSLEKIFVYHGKKDGSDTHPPYFKIYVGVLIGKNYRRFFLYNDGQKSGLIHNNVWTNVSL